MRRFLLVLMVISILVAAAAGGGMLYLNSRLGGRQVLLFVNGMVLDRVGLRLDWRRARGTFLFNLVLDEPVLTTTAGDTLLTARGMRVRFDPWSVLEGGVRLRRVEVDAPRLDTAAFAGMGAGAETAAPTPGDTDEPVGAGEEGSRGAGRSALYFDRVILRDGTVRIADQGLVRAVSGIHFRGGVRISGGGGVEIEGERIQGVLDDWGLEVEDLHGRLAVSGGRLWFIGVEARTPGSRLTASGALTLDETVPGVLRLDLQSNDLSEWWPVLGGEWAGHGPLRLRGRLSEPPWRPEWQVRASGVLGGITIESATLEGSFVDEFVTVELQAQGPLVDGLTAQLRLQTSTGVGEATVRADSLRLDLGPARLPVRLAGLELDAWTMGYDPLQEGGALLLRARGIRTTGLPAEVQADSLQIEVETASGRIRLTSPLAVDGDGFEIRAEGLIDLTEDRIDLVLTGGTWEPSLPTRLAGLAFEGGSTDLNLALTGRARDPDLRGDLYLRKLDRQGLWVESTVFRLDVQEVLGRRWGTFTADLDSLHLDPEFDLPRASLTGRVAGDRVVLEQLRGRWSEGEAFLQGNIMVSQDSIAATFEDGYVDHRELAVRGLGGRITFFPASGIAHFVATGRAADGLARFEGGRDALQVVTVRGTFDDLDVGPFARSLDWPGEIAGIFAGSMEAVIATHVEAIQVQVQVRDPAWSGHQYQLLSLDGSYRQGIVEVERLELEGRGPERVNASGQLHLPGAQAAEAEGLLVLDTVISSLDMVPFGRYLSGHLVTGTVDGTLAARGSFAQPRLDGEVRLTGSRFDSLRAEDIRSRIRYDGQRLIVEEGLLLASGFEARFQAGLPFRLSFDPFLAEIDTTGPLEGRLNASGDPATFVRSLTDQVETMTGQLTADVRLQGSVREPEMSGTIKYRDGSLKPATLGQTIQELKGEVQLEGGRARIVDISGRLPTSLPARRNLLYYVATPFRWAWRLVAGTPEPRGDFHASGEVLLSGPEGPEIVLTLTGKTLGLSDPTGSLAVVADVDLRLDTREGAEQSGLTGHIEVPQGLMDVGFATRLAGSEATGTVEQAEEGGGFPINVDVNVPGGLRVIGEGITFDESLNVELRGDLIVRQDPPGPLYLLGSLETVSGRDMVYAYNRRWSIDRGNITFGTIEEINPNLDIELSTQIEDTEVRILITGTLQEPVTSLSSSSVDLQSQGDILLLLLPVDVAGGRPTGGMTEWATNFIESAVGNQFGRALGVDTFEMEGMPGLGGQNTQISVGKYLGSQYYLRTSYEFGGTTTGFGDIAVEYRLNRSFRLSATRDFRYRRYILELKWRIEY